MAVWEEANYIVVILTMSSWLDYLRSASSPWRYRLIWRLEDTLGVSLTSNDLSRCSPRRRVLWGSPFSQCWRRGWKCIRWGNVHLSISPYRLSFCQIYSSALGINSAPSLDVILRHLRILISSAPLDRWNSERRFPLIKTFTTIFSSLEQQWNKVNPTVKQALRDTPLVPIGHNLIRPSRLYFRSEQ